MEEFNFPGQEKHLKVTISIGIAEYKIGMERIQFIKDADDALYESKKNGRNQVTLYKV